MCDAFAAVRDHAVKTAPVDYNTFVGYYTGRRRTVYQNAVDSLTFTPVRESDAKVRTFVKAEKVNFTAKPDPAPRVIQPRDPRYNVEVGRYLRPIEKLVYRAVDLAWGGPTILKGKNAAETAAAIWNMWCQFRNPVAIGLDASRFDQHVSVDALRWEHSVYRLFFHSREHSQLMKLLSWQLQNKGVAYTATAKVTYSVSGCRMSGDMNTSTGNCLLMSMMVWTWARRQGVSCRLANQGDDCVVIMDSADAARFMDGLDTWFNEMGFTMKVEPPAYKMEHIEFCQSRPVHDGRDWIMVRDPAKCATKDLVTLLDAPRVLQKWLHAIGTCGLSCTGGIPVLQEFYQCMVRSAGAVRAAKFAEEMAVGRGMRFMSAGMERQYCEPTERARESFALAYGINPDEQIILERWLRSSSINQASQFRGFVPGLWTKS